MSDFTLREKILIKLVSFLISFIGRKQDGFYEHKLEHCLHEIFYGNKEQDNAWLREWFSFQTCYG